MAALNRASYREDTPQPIREHFEVLSKRVLLRNVSGTKVDPAHRASEAYQRMLEVQAIAGH